MDGRDIWRALWMPLMLMVVFVLALWGLSGVYVGMKPKPTLDIISGNEIVTDQAEVPITGVVHDSDKVTVSGKEVVVNSDGGFSTLVPVNLGENNVEIAAGKNGQTKTSVKVTREEETKAVAAVTAPVATGGSDLSTTGPIETVSGSFGLAAIMVSLLVLQRSRGQNSLQKAKNLL